MLKLNSKGQARVLEAFFAALLVWSALLLSSPATAPIERNREFGTLTSVGMQALIQLDRDGSLGDLIDEGNWTGLRNSLQTLLPVGVCFNLTVYDESANLVNDVQISNGGIVNEDVVSVEYLCVVTSGRFHYYKVRLQLAVAR